MFNNSRDRDSAYDLIENPHLESSVIATAMSIATCERAMQAGNRAFVAVDGTSLNVVDRKGKKGFGQLGPEKRGARGLQVMNAYCIGMDGAPLGLVDQQYWARPLPRPSRSRLQRARRLRKQPFETKESYRFWTAAEASIVRLAQAGVRAWIVIDREGDNSEILIRLSSQACDFSIRASKDRKLQTAAPSKLRGRLSDQPVLGTFQLHVAHKIGSPARVATVEVRAAKVDLRLNKTKRREESTLTTNAVWVHEVEPPETIGPRDALDWMIYTNRAVETFDDANAIINSYATRWRIEELHRTWKTGACNVEDTQLRSIRAVAAWATILAANAARIERIKYLARVQPTAPATLILSPHEITVLKKVRLREYTPPPTGTPSVGAAVKWIAELGGWIPSNQPAGAITLARGLKVLMQLARGVALKRKPPLQR